jgi:TPR repeat protein
VEAYNRGDFVEAVKRFRGAADQGHAVAQFALGVMCDKGQGDKPIIKLSARGQSQRQRTRVVRFLDQGPKPSFNKNLI